MSISTLDVSLYFCSGFYSRFIIHALNINIHIRYGSSHAGLIEYKIK